MPVKLNSAGGGSVTMDVGSTASNFTQNLPLATTTLVGTDTTQTLTNKTLTSPNIGGTPVMNASVITSGTARASTSGTVIDFTGIPSYVKRITVMFSGVSTSGTSAMQVQLSTGTVKTTGYTSSSGRTISSAIDATHITSGLIITGTQVAAQAFTGVFTISNFSTNWFGNGGVSSGSTYFFSSGGADLGGTLTAIRITTVNGTDTFDAGSINILYE